VCFEIEGFLLYTNHIVTSESLTIAVSSRSHCSKVACLVLSFAVGFGTPIEECEGEVSLFPCITP
jgi:hypothetical protein